MEKPVAVPCQSTPCCPAGARAGYFATKIGKYWHVLAVPCRAPFCPFLPLFAPFCPFLPLFAPLGHGTARHGTARHGTARYGTARARGTCVKVYDTWHTKLRFVNHLCPYGVTPSCQSEIGTKCGARGCGG